MLRPLLPFTLFLTLAAPVLAAPEATPAPTRGARVPVPTGQPATPIAAKPAPASVALPPLPPGAEELTFADFFKLPVGPRGLDLTERLKALDGRRVRILGHMVKEDLTPCNSCPVLPNGAQRARPAWMEFVVPGRMMFTEQPAMVSHAHYGLADDLPPQTLFVTVPDKFGELVPFTPGPMLLTGVLSVGNKPEPDGRISVVRLTLDPPAHAGAASAKSLSATNPTANQPTK